MVKRGLDSLTLAPGEQCEVDKQTGLLTVKEADLVTTLAWKNGEFVFKNVTLENMINELSRWYDMEVVYESEALKDSDAAVLGASALGWELRDIK
jgi:ferric-dicitrate binding protein FerR (iron transport regulator)